MAKEFIKGIEKDTRRKNRPDRVPLHEQRDGMTVKNKEDGFVYRWVNDTDNGSRIDKFKQAGYEVAPKQEFIGDPTEDDRFAIDGTSSVVKKHVGGGVHAILMRQREEWYSEDQKAKQRHVDELEAEIKREALAKFSEIRNPKLDITSNKKV